MKFAVSKERWMLAGIAGLLAFAALAASRAAEAASGAETSDLVFGRPDLVRAIGAREPPRFDFQSFSAGEAARPFVAGAATGAIEFVAMRIAGPSLVPPAALDWPRAGGTSEAGGQFTPSGSASAVEDASWRDDARNVARGSGPSWRRWGMAVAGFAAAVVFLDAIRRFRHRRARQARAFPRAVSIAGRRARAQDPTLAASPRAPELRADRIRAHRFHQGVTTRQTSASCRTTLLGRRGADHRFSMQ